MPDLDVPKKEADPAASEGEQPKDSPKPADPGFKSPESKDAVLADLLKERDLRKNLQGDVAERDTQVQTLTGSLEEKTTAITERDALIVEKDAEIAVLSLALKHGITEDADLSLLTSITDSTKRAELAERLAKGAGVVRKSGTGSGDSLVGGSIAERRRLIAERKKK